MVIIILFYTCDNIIVIKSTIDNKYYIVKNIENKQMASNILAIINNNIFLMVRYFEKNINKMNSNYKIIKRLIKGTKKMIIMENVTDIGTSYVIRKGDRLVLCLRSRKNTNIFHDMNTMMYVVIHELSHIACPEYGHTKLYHKIFRYLLKIAIEIGIYKQVDYENNPVEYCDLIINRTVQPAEYE